MRHGPLVVIFLLAVILLPGVVFSSNDTLVVPKSIDTQSWFHISEQDLLANDTSGATIVSFTPTSRGSLLPDGSGLKYQPTAEFRAAGMDSFSYVFDAGSGARAVVFLIPATMEDPLLSTDLRLEVGELSPTLILREGTLGAGGALGTIADFRLVTEETEDNGYLSAVLSQAFEGPSDTGGNSTEGELDPAGFSMMIGEQATIATVLVNGLVDMQLVLSKQGAFYTLSAQTWRDDGQLIKTLSAPFEDSLSFWVGMWPTSGIGALDGGLALRFGNRVVASRSGLDNLSAFSASEVEVRFGVMGADGSGKLLLSNPRFWLAPRIPPRLTPIFADGGESGDTSAWTSEVGTLGSSTTAAIRGTRGLMIPATGAAYLIDESPATEPHYRARFNLDARDLTLAEGSHLTVLKGIGGSVTPFVIQLSRESGVLNLCGTAWVNSGPPIGIGCSEIDAETAHSIEVKWWAGSEPEGNGGLSIHRADPSISGGNTGVGFNSSLQNTGQSIDTVHFGVVESDATLAGTLHLDDFESWR